MCQVLFLLSELPPVMSKKADYHSDSIGSINENENENLGA